MRTTLLLHVLAGGLGLLSGYVALYAAKGGTLHRKSGIFFVYVMVTMATTGMLIAGIDGVAPAINIPTALLTLYMVITSMTTVRPAAGGSRWPNVLAMSAAAAIGLTCFTLGVNAIAKGGADAGLAYPLFLFGIAALAAGEGDRRMLRNGSLRGAPRIVRHLWRMCFGLFIASIAFYAGPNRLPDALRSPVFRAAGVLLPLAVMTYWLWWLRSKPSSRRLPHMTIPEAA